MNKAFEVGCCKWIGSKRYVKMEKLIFIRVNDGVLFLIYDDEGCLREMFFKKLKDTAIVRHTTKNYARLKLYYDEVNNYFRIHNNWLDVIWTKIVHT